MVTLHATVESPAMEPEVLIGALPLLLQRFRALRFDPDGVARFSVGRRAGLRLTAGAAGRVGARYHVIAASAAEEPARSVSGPGASDIAQQPSASGRAPAFDTEIRADTAEVAEVAIEYAEGRASLAVDRPGFPERLRVRADLALDDVPALLGQQLTGTLTIRLADLWEVPGPQVAAHAELRAVQIQAIAEVRPQPDGNWRTTLQLTGRARGIGVLAVPAWPFVRRRIRAALATGLRRAMTDLAQQAARLACGTTGSAEVADRAWAALPDLLAR